jgi:acetyl-CoA carboxylase/biotin carboxylase 1
MASTVNGVNGTPARRSTLVNGTTTSEWQAKHSLAAHFIGGNRLEKAPPSKVKDFVQAHDGHSVITSVCRVTDKTFAGSAADMAL